MSQQTLSLGRIVSWNFPEGLTRTHAEVVAALTKAGLDPKAAKKLNKRHAFVRVMREMAKAKLLRVVHENRDCIRFQMNAVNYIGSSLVDYPLETHLELSKVTGLLSCPDAGLLAAVSAQMAIAVETRRNADFTRLLNQLFAAHADLFSIKGGCYFVPEKHVAFCDKVEIFINTIGGSMLQFMIPDAGPQTQSVSIVVADGIEQEIKEYESKIESLTYESTLAAFDAAGQALSYAARRIAEYQTYLNTHATRLEDHLAYVASRLAAKRNPATV